MIHKIKNHPVTKHTARIISFKLKLILFLALPLVVFTLITTRTELVPGIKSFVVLSGSMEPTLPVGSVVYVQKSPSYTSGDVISFTNEAGQTVTHRIVENSNEGFITKGDANDSPDQAIVTKSSVIGKSLFSIPYVGQIINFIRTPTGFVLFIIVPTVVFILSEFWAIKKEIEKEVEKKLLHKMQNNN